MTRPLPARSASPFFGVARGRRRGFPTQASEGEEVYGLSHRFLWAKKAGMKGKRTSVGFRSILRFVLIVCVCLVATILKYVLPSRCGLTQLGTNKKE